MPALLLVFLLIPSFNGYSGQRNAARSNPSQDRVVVQRRRIVLVRSPRIAKAFPDRKTAVVSYPVISGLRDRAVLHRVRSLFDFKNIFDYTLQEYRDDSWLSEFDFIVNYNSNYLFDITFTQSGVGAYPDEQSKHFLIDLKTGRVIRATDVFLVDQLAILATLVDEKLQAEIKKMAEDIQPSDLDAAESKSIVEGLQQLKFQVKDLDEFSVNNKGVTFLYDAGLPHVIQAFEPEARYFFAYSELKPFLNTKGPLGQFVR